MQRWMPSVRNAPAPVARRRPALAGAAGAAAAALAADAAGGRLRRTRPTSTGTTTTVVGQLLQTWAETEHGGTTAAGEDGGLQS